MPKTGLGVLLGMLWAGSAPAAPIVATDLGRVQGAPLDVALAFRGIPYAAPPVGPLRWREARPAKPWRGVRDGRNFGSICPQRPDQRTAGVPQSEDCLTLNIVTPGLRGRLPVLVEIHGGAFAMGSARAHTGERVPAIVRKGVVLVAPQYRIGRLGFFAHPALTREAARGTGNFWLSDQIEALRWVKRNIARFGGDPNRVTILGCSAGGSSVNALMTSPAARGLFGRASARSGGGFFNADRPLATAEDQGKAFAARAGAGDLQALRRLTVEQVLAADPGLPNFGAIVDGRLLPEPVSIAFARGRQARVPYVSGSTSNEASVFGLMGFDAAVLKARFGIDLDALRPVYGPLAEAELLRRIQTDFIFTSAALGMAGLAARWAPAWSYHFDYVPPSLRAASPGAPHCADMPYLFGDGSEATAEERALAATMQAQLYNFIVLGDPNGPGLPDWPATKPGALSPLVIGTSVTAVPGFQAERLRPWFAKWRAEKGQDTLP